VAIAACLLKVAMWVSPPYTMLLNRQKLDVVSNIEGQG